MEEAFCIQLGITPFNQDNFTSQDFLNFCSIFLAEVQKDHIPKETWKLRVTLM
jgi:hypothetical protein